MGYEQFALKNKTKKTEKSEMQIASQKPKTITELEEEIVEFWEKDKTFEKSLKQNEKSEPFVFYDGPPFATGLPHYGHLLASIEKDVIPRFWTMRGKYIRRVWGWDCHGLPIENIAERELGINSKDEIEKMGVEKFNKFCRSKVMSYASDWEKVIKRIGRWVDMKNAYKTMDNEYIETVWWIFKQMWEKGLIYEGEKILMYCPRCSTPLAKSEIAMEDSYKKVKDETLTIKFKLKNENAYALAWTTTPWTLPANLALTVNPNLDYSYLKDKSDGTVYILATALIGKFFKSEDQYELIKTIKGEELEGKKYEPLFPYFSNFSNSFRIVLGDFVTAEDGTGIVHTAPAFGEDDYYVCKANGIDFVSPVNEIGRFDKTVTDFAGQYIFDANKEIIIFLKKQGKVVKIEKKEHDYPFCHRCDTPLFYKSLPAVFVNIQKIKQNLLASNKTVNWNPEFLKEGRVKYTFETAPDWNLSRNRYWAASIPIWKSKSGKTKVIGSIEELKKYATKLPKEKIDLHKDFVDKIKLKDESGEEMTRIPDVFDCWFESGSMPYAQFHYPFENKELFEKNYPADFIAEGLDQTRGWFYTLQVIGTALFNKSPFKNVLVNGLILAEDGKKMSKKLKNYPDPSYLIDKYGVDALRCYLLGSSVMNADNFNFSEKGVEEVYKKVLMLLYNVNNFYKLYAGKEKSNPNSKNVIDKWIISRVHSLIHIVQDSLEKYDTITTANEIKIFVEDLSTWYVRRCRERFNENDLQAKETLKYILENFVKVSAPLMPFSSEIIWKELGNKKSVHLESWPKYEYKLFNKELEEDMKKVREIVSIALRERDIQKMPLKQPLLKLTISGYEIPTEYHMIIEEELNVKELEFKKSEEKKLELDLTITPELEAEGFARELTRLVQAARKKAGLVKEDLIELVLEFEHKNKKLVEKYVTEEQKRIGAKNIQFEHKNKSQKFDYSEEAKIKEISYKLLFSKTSSRK
ncbi:Isoleucine--tRNA ligase [uncultured archaeon]|nr:Isoleucine--tRNA ligase [uncultured archaeon]